MQANCNTGALYFFLKRKLIAKAYIVFHKTCEEIP